MAVSLSDFLSNLQANQNTYITRYKKKVREANTQVQDFQDSLADFRKKVYKLKDYDSDNVIKDHVKKQLDNLTDSYNTLLESTSSLEESGKKNDELTKSMKKLEQLFDDNASTLRKLGVRKDNNKWKFNEDTFDDLEKNEMNKLCKKLFVGKDSFIDQVAKNIRKTERYAAEAEYTTNIRKFHKITQYEASEISTAQGLSAMRESLDEASAYVENQGGMTEAESVNVIKKYVSAYQDVMSVGSTLESSYITAMKNLNKSDDVKTQLGKIGVTVDENGELGIDNLDGITKDDTFSNTLQALFAKDPTKTDTYAVTMQTLCNNAINEVLRADKIGVSFDETI